MRVAQDEDLDALVRQRVRGLRVDRGWSLDALAARCGLSPSTLSRLETGSRRIGLDQLAAIARALGVSLDELVAADGDEDVVIRPERHEEQGVTTWVLSRTSGPQGVTVARMLLTRPAPRRSDAALRVHPGRDWFTVLSGTVVLLLGERTLRVEVGEAAEFSTLVPHAFGADGGPALLLGIFDHGGRRAHLR